MAHQTSENQRKQTTPHIIGRLMDADFFRGAGRLGFVPICELMDRLVGNSLANGSTMNCSRSFGRGGLLARSRQWERDYPFLD
jgi:hypothetical protein